MNFTSAESKFEGWSFAEDFCRQRATALSRWSSFAEIAEAIVKGAVAAVEWEGAQHERLAGCRRAAFELRFADADVCDAFYNSPAGYRAQFARGAQDGGDANRWLIWRLEPVLLTACQERGIDVDPVQRSLRGGQAKLWIAEPSDMSHLSGPLVIRCHQWGGPGECAPTVTSLELKGAWLDSNNSAVSFSGKESRAEALHTTGFT